MPAAVAKVRLKSTRQHRGRRPDVHITRDCGQSGADRLGPQSGGPWKRIHLTSTNGRALGLLRVSVIRSESTTRSPRCDIAVWQMVVNPWRPLESNALLPTFLPSGVAAYHAVPLGTRIIARALNTSYLTGCGIATLSAELGLRCRFQKREVVAVSVHLIISGNGIDVAPPSLVQRTTWTAEPVNSPTSGS
jgi:hypothetical protein